LSDRSSHEEESESLLVDRTAGRLARWLRFLGLDTEYAATCDASVITRAARQSGRMVVTRNRSLAARMGRCGILLTSEHLADQIRQVVSVVGLESCEPFSRCSTCNVRLTEVARGSVKGRVPAYVYEHHGRFSMCPVCGRYYWRGTHWHVIQGEIEKIMGGIPDGNQ
jgi:uncharacterized protein with PIN domain